MSKVIFFIQAYNNETTLRRAVDSILNQTCGDIVLYLADDVSTDGTRDIMREYADKDNRVRTIFHSTNQGAAGASGAYPFALEVCALIDEYDDDDDYFCMLDADDEYKSDFLEKMLAFAGDNDLDIAACGYSSMIAKTGEVYDVRVPAVNQIISGEAFDLQFPAYHQFFRAIWGKIYRISVLKKCDYTNYLNLKKAGHGADALFNLPALLHAGRIGILAENLMTYFVAPGSVSKTFKSGRINADRLVIEDSMDFLVKKAGRVSTVNKEFLFGVYLLAIMDSLSALIQSDMGTDEKLALIDDIIKYPLTEELLNLDFSATTVLSSPAMIDTKNRFINDLSSWVSEHYED